MLYDNITFVFPQQLLTADVFKQYATPYPSVLAAMIRLVCSVYLLHIFPTFNFINSNLECLKNVHFLPYECRHNVMVWMMGDVSREGVVSLENQTKADNYEILLLIDNCLRPLRCSRCSGKC
jgi:hypothetical protein